MNNADVLSVMHKTDKQAASMIQHVMVTLHKNGVTVAFSNPQGRRVDYKVTQGDASKVAKVCDTAGLICTDTYMEVPA